MGNKAAATVRFFAGGQGKLVVGKKMFGGFYIKIKWRGFIGMCWSKIE